MFPAFSYWRLSVIIGLMALWGLGSPFLGNKLWQKRQDKAQISYETVLIDHSESQKVTPQSIEYSSMSFVLIGMGLSLVGLLILIIWRSHQHQKALNHHLTKHSLALETAKIDLKNHFQKRLDELETLNQAKTELLSHLSHELRTPLHIIQGYLELLQQDPHLNQQQQADLTVVGNNSHILMTLLDEIVEMIEIEWGNVTLQPTCFNLRYLVQEVLNTLQPKSLEKGLQLRSYIAPEVPQSIKADEGKVRQILFNLLDNGIKFTHQGSVILKVAGSDHRWNLDEDSGILNRDHSYTLFFEIEDTGIGIEEDQLTQIFTPFFRGNVADNLYQGSGLGLFISQQFVKLMGGSLHISSKLGQGTLVQGKVRVELPDDGEIPLISSDRPIIGLAINQPKYRILVVDDKAENRQLLRRLLAPLGFQVKEAINGKNALEVWSTWRPHLIFMDTRMPTMDGYEAIEQIKDYTQEHSTIIIAVSSGVIESKQAKILLKHCDDILRRPFDLKVLLETLAHHLNLKYQYESLDREGLNAWDADSNYPELKPRDLDSLPDLLKAEMYQAASAGNQRQLEILMQQIPSDQTLLIKQIQTLISQFNFRKIRELTQTYSNPKKGD